MLKLIKRLAGVKDPEPANPARRPRARKSSFSDLSAPAPLPEVVEGNDETDWDMWKDSVDSQMQGLSRSDHQYQDTQPSELDELDPFSRVGKNRDA
ncbi:MAG TPA: hypothetical protein VK996_08035 [Ramlibacter sp.]|nr:hypothetical protein [Ramlibacter sp.]